MTFSDPVTVTLALEGVWIHHPDDPEGTAHQFRFGKASRSRSTDVDLEQNYYAGREFPVVDFGEQAAERLDVRVDVPFGSDDVAALDAFARSRRAVVVRDNRGRVITPAVLSGYREEDTETGYRVSVQASRADG